MALKGLNHHPKYANCFLDLTRMISLATTFRQKSSAGFNSTSRSILMMGRLANNEKRPIRSATGYSEQIATPSLPLYFLFVCPYLHLYRLYLFASPSISSQSSLSSVNIHWIIFVFCSTEDPLVLPKNPNIPFALPFAMILVVLPPKPRPILTVPSLWPLRGCKVLSIASSAKAIESPNFGLIGVCP